MKKERGITLVALVITIIVLLILAAIAFSLLGKNNIIEKAKEAKKEADKARTVEEGQFANMIKEINKNTGIDEDYNPSVGPVEDIPDWKLVRVITSPNYPEDYPNNCNELYYETFGNNVIGVKLEFEYVILELTDRYRCTADYIRVKGKDTEYSESFCYFKTNYTLRGNFYKLHFYTDSSVVAPGFKCNVYITTNPDLMKNENILQ